MTHFYKNNFFKQFSTSKMQKQKIAFSSQESQSKLTVIFFRFPTSMLTGRHSPFKPISICLQTDCEGIWAGSHFTPRSHPTGRSERPGHLLHFAVHRLDHHRRPQNNHFRRAAPRDPLQGLGDHNGGRRLLLSCLQSCDQCDQCGECPVLDAPTGGHNPAQHSGKGFFFRLFYSK